MVEDSGLGNHGSGCCLTTRIDDIELRIILLDSPAEDALVCAIILERS